MAETTAPGTLDPGALSDTERTRLRRQLRRLESASGQEGRSASLHFGGKGGEDVSLPEGFSRVIAEALAEVAAGRRVHLASDDEELTTQEAADFLGVSRPYLIGLLEEGEIPFHKVGTHRRVLFGDALAYRREMRASQEEAFAALTRQAQELGMGYEEEDAGEKQ